MHHCLESGKRWVSETRVQRLRREVEHGEVAEILKDL